MTEVEKLQEKIDQMERDRVRMLEESDSKRSESIAGLFFFGLILILIFAQG